MINYLSKPFIWFFKLEAASGLVLLFAAIIALIISNSGLSELYFCILTVLLNPNGVGRIINSYFTIIQLKLEGKKRNSQYNCLLVVA